MGSKTLIFLLDAGLKASMIIFFYLLGISVLCQFKS